MFTKGEIPTFDRFQVACYKRNLKEISLANSTSFPSTDSVALPASSTRALSLERTCVPWYVWCSVAAVVSVMTGGYWDISWHMTIGRDTFWTPAHMMIYFSGVLAGVSCGYLILTSTFSGEGGASVRIWGFRAPLGAFISAWGGVTMIVSAPFDNWWHNAYGLDVKIFSPPHIVLDSGIFAVQLGGLILIAGAMNRAESRRREKLEWLFLYLGGMVLTLGLTSVWEYTYRVHLHNARCYRAISLVAPVLLVGTARASGRRFGATLVATVYSLFELLMLWVLPLFPARPKLGPVYHSITHMVPLEFPLLLIVPGIFLDILWPSAARWNKWFQAAAGALVFLISLVPAEWFFANFLMSPASRNWVFGTHYFAYFQGPNSLGVRYLFYFPEHSPAELWLGLAEAAGLAFLSTRVGMALGDWMGRLRR